MYWDQDQFNDPTLGRTYRLQVDEAKSSAFAGKEGAAATPALGAVNGDLFAEAA